MFKRLHTQFTLFSTAVTSLILIAMTCICLFISEADASRENYLSFQTNTNTMLSYLNSQTIISHQWILEMEENYGVQIKIGDNGRELFQGLLVHTKEASQLFAEAEETARDSYDLDIHEDVQNPYTPATAVFPLGNSKSYYASVSQIPRDAGSLSVTILYSLGHEHALTARRRIAFAAAAGLGILLLWSFSWFFTRRLIRPLEDNQKKQSQFVAAASHELRTPLAVILSSNAALKGAPPNRQEQFISHIQEEGERMNRLIQDLLSLSRADSSIWPVQLADTEPDTLLLNIYEKYQGQAEAKQLCWNIILPECAVSREFWDGDRIAQVLEILTDNAISYTPAGGCVTLSLGIGKGYTEYRVADNGPGIPDTEKSAVFQRFYRLDQSHHEKEHFGLGLCIAEEIVRMHKGRIFVEDTPGGGATFVVRL